MISGMVPGALVLVRLLAAPLLKKSVDLLALLPHVAVNLFEHLSDPHSSAFHSDSLGLQFMPVSRTEEVHRPSTGLVLLWIVVFEITPLGLFGNWRWYLAEFELVIL